LQVLVAILRAGIAGVDQEADVTDAGFPAIADEQGDVRIELVGQLRIDAARQARDREAVEVERTARRHVDLAGKAGLDLVGRAGLVDVDLLDEVGRDILQRERCTRSGKDIAAVQRGQRIGEATDRDRAGFAACSVGDLDTGDALERFDHVVVGQLADVFSHDRVDDLDVVLAAVDGTDDRCTHARDDDVLGSRLRVVGGLRNGFLSLRDGGEAECEYGCCAESEWLECHGSTLPLGLAHTMPLQLLGLIISLTIALQGEKGSLC